MLYFANWKVLLICGICALGVLLSLPNLFTPAELARLPSFIPHKQVALGLDLRGGSYLLLEVDVAAAQRDHLNAIVDSVRNTLRDAKIGYTGLNVEGDAIVFSIRERDRIDEARQALAKIDSDLTVEVGVDLGQRLPGLVDAVALADREDDRVALDVEAGVADLGVAQGVAHAVDDRVEVVALRRGNVYFEQQIGAAAQIEAERHLPVRNFFREKRELRRREQVRQAQ